MPAVSLADRMLLHLSTRKKAEIQAIPVGGGLHPFPLTDGLRQIVSDRLTFAGEHLRIGDKLLFELHFRAAISRHYYAMYHSARAIVFAVHGGDDFQQHSVLPRHLPNNMTDATVREVQLTDARLLRNEADYDLYPIGQSDWETDGRRLATVAADFVKACEDFALLNGIV
ncbi:hypothetical protein [Nonomuraea cavernae]|uniref:HEPN domain-containing protein n=1 Tax=Nonomuraea cavernae TaxID=2045107 RepID=A0A917ZKW8_9ACTN|nr:hypothetical protein [Nonomuraea cavernae]MCA2191008.1 hypothetical protein [Nonomuraea cavernae]GGO83717.1 hypothetical protein GCM10012289_77780 [Nonomuraea cavernae]